MKEKVKKLWLEALRSGKYKQTKRVLKNEEGYCCLGVLCDLHRKVTKTKGNVWTKDNYYLGSNSCLSKEVRHWAGFDKYSNTSIDIKIGGEITNLADINDNRDRSFKQIADIIEKQL